jgi:hypothetical protein
MNGGEEWIMTFLQRLTCAAAFSLFALTAWAQTPSASQQTTGCQFTDGGQLSLRYEEVPARGNDLPAHVWSPGESPMYLFTSTAIKVGDTVIPPGAYSLYVASEKQRWTLVVNKDVTSKKYDAAQDLARLPMDRGTIDEPSKEVNLAFGHIAPRQCSLRIYYGKIGAWAVFGEP